MLFCIIFLFLLFPNVLTSKTYNCGIFVQTIYLETETLGFFHSDKFPTSKNCFVLCGCNIVFKSKNISEELTFTLVYDVGGYSENILLGPSLHYTNYIYFEENITTNLIATNMNADFFQKVFYSGYVIFESSSSNYPLEFTKDKPLNIDDESQIIHLYSSYNVSLMERNYTCEWQFTAPPGYGMKIYFLIGLISITQAELIVENSTQIFVNTRSYREFYPFYNEDNYIKITLYPGSQPFIQPDPSDPGFEFHGVVSIVKQNFKKENKCITKYVGETMIWRNYETEYELYNNNLHCQLEVNVPSNSEIYVTGFNEMEPEADYIVFFDENNQSYSLPSYTNTLSIIQFMIFSKHFPNGSNFLFEFYSDGSSQWGSFSMNFTTIKCGCSDYILPCDNQTHFVMGDTPLFCGNLRCNFTISPCPTKYISISFEFPLFYNDNDIFRIISNNETFYHFNDPYKIEIIGGQNVLLDQVYFNMVLHSEYINIFEIITFPTDLPRAMSIIVEPLYLPPDHYIEIPHNFTNYVIDILEANFTYVKIKNMEQNAKYVLYCNTFDSIDIFNNESLTVLLDYKRNIELDYSNLTIETNEFAIVLRNFTAGAVFLIVTRESPKGCVFKNNVMTYVYTDFSGPRSFGALANEKDSCTIFLLLPKCGLYNCVMTKFWTTSSTENVKVYLGTDQTILFFEFNFATSNSLQSLMLAGGIYTFVIPKKDALVFSIDVNSFPFHSQYRSILATPYLGALLPTIEFWPKDGCLMSLKITTIYCNLSKNDELYICGNSDTACSPTDRLYIKKTGDVINLDKSEIAVYYTAQQRTKNSGAIFLIENLGFCNCSNLFGSVYRQSCG